MLPPRLQAGPVLPFPVKSGITLLALPLRVRCVLSAPLSHVLILSQGDGQVWEDRERFHFSYVAVLSLPGIQGSVDVKQAFDN